MELLLQAFDQIPWERTVLTGLRLLLILILAWVALFALRTALRRLERRLIRQGTAAGEVPSESAKRVGTLARLLRQAVAIAVWLMAGLVMLRDLGVEIAPILASAGVVGVALGFGAQHLVRDVIAGFFLILENQVRIGDAAVINGVAGLVEKLNFRTIVLRDVSGVVHIFPNGSIVSIANRTRDWSAYVFEIAIAYGEEVDRVVGVMQDTGAMLRADARFAPFILEDIEVFGVETLADTGVVIKGRIKTVPNKQWEVGREFLRRLKAAFGGQGVRLAASPAPAGAAAPKPGVAGP